MATKSIYVVEDAAVTRLKSYAPEGPGDCGMHRQHTRQEPPICVPCAVRVRSTETSKHDCECRASRSGFNSAARVSVIESSHADASDF